MSDKSSGNNDCYIKLNNVSVNGIDTSTRASSIRQLIASDKKKIKSSVIPILDNISFEAKPGDRIGLVGRNGSGKSSLLKVICGIYPIESGKIEKRGTVAPLVEMGVGFNQELSGRQNIKLTLIYSGRLGSYSKELEEEIIEFSELGDKIDLPLKTYSSGMQSRLAFSASIFQKPEHIDS